MKSYITTTSVSITDIGPPAWNRLQPRRQVCPFGVRRLVNHNIYDALLSILENRQAEYVPAGKINSVISDEDRAELLRVGRTPAQIARLEARFAMNAVEISQCVPLALYSQLNRVGDEGIIFDNRIVAVPNFILDVLACNQLETMFNRDDLAACPGFILREGTLRLDFDEYLPRRGFLVPVIRDNLIVAIKVYRRPNDEIPFTLRTRVGEVASDA